MEERMLDTEDTVEKMGTLVRESVNSKDLLNRKAHYYDQCELLVERNLNSRVLMNLDGIQGKENSQTC